MDRDSRAKLAALFIQIFTGIQTALNDVVADAHICCGALERSHGSPAG
jgi:hypothetical protein